jgi:hypothetical protein
MSEVRLKKLPRRYPEPSLMPVVFLAGGALLAAMGFGWIMSSPDPAAHVAAVSDAR